VRKIRPLGAEWRDSAARIVHAANIGTSIAWNERNGTLSLTRARHRFGGMFPPSRHGDATLLLNDFLARWAFSWVLGRADLTRKLNGSFGDIADAGARPLIYSSCPCQNSLPLKPLATDACCVALYTGDTAAPSSSSAASSPNKHSNRFLLPRYRYCGATCMYP
jgi:hypothetical protein